MGCVLTVEALRLTETTCPPLVLFLQLALSSDNISSLQTPLVSLNLNVKRNGHVTPVAIEMNREELNTLISSLEAANKVENYY